MESIGEADEVCNSVITEYQNIERREAQGSSSGYAMADIDDAAAIDPTMKTKPKIKFPAF